MLYLLGLQPLQLILQNFLLLLQSFVLFLFGGELQRPLHLLQTLTMGKPEGHAGGRHRRLCVCHYHRSLRLLDLLLLELILLQLGLEIGLELGQFGLLYFHLFSALRYRLRAQRRLLGELHADRPRRLRLLRGFGRFGWLRRLGLLRCSFTLLWRWLRLHLLLLVLLLLVLLLLVLLPLTPLIRPQLL